jgi:hypothetical protein
MEDTPALFASWLYHRTPTAPFDVLTQSQSMTKIKSKDKKVQNQYVKGYTSIHARYIKKIKNLI